MDDEADAGVTAADEEDIHRIDWRALDLDPHNPRLVDADAEGNSVPLTADEAAMRLLEKHDPIAIGRSMVEFGYFPSDPLIAYQVDDRFVVVEGNRRLLAIKLLLDPEFRGRLQDVDPEWATLASTSTDTQRARLEMIPVQVVASRDDAAPVIGFRHIVGIKKWDAYEKAAFVRQLIRRVVEDEQDDQAAFDRVSVLTGESVSRIRRYVRDYTILRQAETAGLDVAGARDEFGVFTRALNTAGVTSFIGAASVGEVTASMEKGYSAPEKNVAKVLSWIYGDRCNDPVFTDARKLTELSKVLQSEEATQHLETTRDLERSAALAGAVRDRVLQEGAKALTAMRRMVEDLPKIERDGAVNGLIEDLAAAVGALVSGAAMPPSTSMSPDGVDDYDLTAEDDVNDDDDADGR